MPEGQDREQRTERATPKRRQEAREKGNVAFSREISSVFSLMGGLLFFYFFGQRFLTDISMLMTKFFTDVSSFPLEQIDDVGYLLSFLIESFIKTLGPLMLMAVVFSIAGCILQLQGFLFSLYPIQPNFSKLDPIRGVIRLFSKNSIMELFKSLFKIGVVGYVSYSIVRNEWHVLPSIMEQDISHIMMYIFGIMFKICLWTFWVLLILSIIDYGYQRWVYEESLKMTKQELLDERKETEGDPLIKSRIKRIHQERMKQIIMKAVPKADVVITNPVRLAVVLKYDHKDMPAPRLLAKGAGVIAAKIREIAYKNNIPVIENKPLAQIIFRSVKIDEYIPESLYKAVAEILAYVYKLNKKIDMLMSY